MKIFRSAHDAIGEEESFERVQELRPTSAAPNSIEQFIHLVKKFLAHAELTSTALPCMILRTRRKSSPRSPQNVRRCLA